MAAGGIAAVGTTGAADGRRRRFPLERLGRLGAGWRLAVSAGAVGVVPRVVSRAGAVRRERRAVMAVAGGGEWLAVVSCLSR